MSKNVRNIAARVIVFTIIGAGGVTALGTMAMAETATTTGVSTATVTPSPTPTPTPSVPSGNTPWG
jgi:hypothetical protein